MNNRRKLLVALCAGVLTAPSTSFAQKQGKVWRIGFFYYGSRRSAQETGRYNAFLQGMRERGYVEGKNFVIEARFADGRAERLPALVTELARLNVDVIVATSSVVYQSLQRATTATPVVMTVAADPVSDGFANSLARPGGKFTGLSDNVAELFPKQMEMLRIAVPKLSRIAALMNPENAGLSERLKSVQAAAQKVGVTVMRADGGTIEGIEQSFAAMSRERVQAVFILNDTFFVQQLRMIANLAITHRLVSIYGSRDYAEAGGLMAYGPDMTDNFRRAAIYVDKILKGAKPGELPIEQPTRYLLTINRKTAKAIGLTLPSELLLRADKVIE